MSARSQAPLAASLDTQGYSVNDIIHILMAEGGQV